ncbi:hypothetical protein [Aquimarina longa]|uniref:hypothetical protein n=1 Tax=Aquimarina longa TaxID=1080221 RepID=UPI000780D13B|nr:hypothetical protein [Aquimarina longa]
MSNQYLDGQISGIVKETFDDAIRNEALNEIDQQLEIEFKKEDRPKRNNNHFISLFLKMY